MDFQLQFFAIFFQIDGRCQEAMHSLIDLCRRGPKAASTAVFRHANVVSIVRKIAISNRPGSSGGPSDHIGA